MLCLKPAAAMPRAPNPCPTTTHPTSLDAQQKAGGKAKAAAAAAAAAYDDEALAAFGLKVSAYLY